MVQPSRVDGGPATGRFGTLTRAVLSENVDGAVVTVDTGRPNDPSVTGVGTVAGQGLASVGMAVQKRGRTTEHTFGTVMSTDFTVSIPYGSDVGTRTLRRQIRIDPDLSRGPRFSDRGDSGSVVLDMSRNVVGLLFAGATDGSMTFANPIQAALDELNVDLVVQGLIPIVTRPVICDILVTRIADCHPLTRTIACNIVTRPATCRITRHVFCDDLVTRSADCLVTRRCPVTRVCGPDDFDPLPPFERPRVGTGRSGSAADLYGVDGSDLEAGFVAGYLAALEAVAGEESKTPGS
jgi:hypothetical protein